MEQVIADVLEDRPTATSLAQRIQKYYFDQKFDLGSVDSLLAPVFQRDVHLLEQVLIALARERLSP
jgi:hypothetical protein